MMGRKVNGQKAAAGFVLVLALLMLLVVTLIGVSAIDTSTIETQISGNNRVSVEAFYVAEAGINEAAGRLSRGATGTNGESVEITDGRPASPEWKLYLSTRTDKATRIGYDVGNPDHVLAQSIQNQADFAVEITHKVDAGNQVITESGFPLYIATSHGFTKEGGNKTVQVELRKIPEMDPPAALYSKAPVQVQGSSTVITGMDSCPIGGHYGNKTGVMTTTSSISQSGSPVVTGVPPQVTESSVNVRLNSIVDDLKESANFEYEYNRDVTLTGYSDSWGNPSPNGTAHPLAYTGPLNIVYFKMSGARTLKLAGGSHGAGILLVHGNLEINGGFRWYGVIIVTGTFTFTGGGEKNITGAVFTGESPSVASDLGGNVGILYCSDAVRRVNDVLPRIKMTQWREVF